MSDELNTTSTDALHWAEHFCKTLKKINRAEYPGRRTDMDVGWVQGWFANYWAAVNDPLQKQIDELNDRIKNVTFNYQGIEKRQRERIDQLHQNAAFFKCCALSGEKPEDGAEPYPPK